MRVVLHLINSIFDLGPLRCIHSKCKTGQAVHLPADLRERFRKKFPPQILPVEWVCDPLKTHFWYCSWEIWTNPPNITIRYLYGHYFRGQRDTTGCCSDPWHREKVPCMGWPVTCSLLQKLLTFGYYLAVSAGTGGQHKGQVKRKNKVQKKIWKKCHVLFAWLCD